MNYLRFILLCLFIVACKGPEPRKAIQVKTTSFLKQSVERNKNLLAKEEKSIKAIIAKDSMHNYIASANGSWYYYQARDTTDSYTPKAEDLVTMTYNLVSFENDTIYSQKNIGVIKYKVDKQDLPPAIRSGVKLLKEGESATFIFPSSKGFGYHGDNNKIGANIPLISTLSIFKIEKDSLSKLKP